MLPLLLALPLACQPGKEADLKGGTTAPVDDCAVVDPYPSRLIDSAGLDGGYGTLRFVARDGNTLQAWTYRASTFDPTTGPILFVMHGMGRTAESYLQAMVPVAEAHGALAVAPEFPADLYPTSDAYTLGLGVWTTPYGSEYVPELWREPSDYLCSELEHLFEAIKGELGSEACDYLLFGHSAGAQFIHRFMTFRSDARVRRAVAANAGWYTRPSTGGGHDADLFMPYGLQGSPLTDADMAPAFDRELIALLGEEDTATSDEDASLRGTDQAEAQGANRLERGQSYLADARAQAETLGVPLSWIEDTVPHAGHDKDQVAAWAGWYLFREGGQLPADTCHPSTREDAGGLVLNEVHADPASGLQGDANGDGRRDAAEDEFLELVNTSETRLCLFGWTLSDVGHGIVASLPPGVEVAPGQALVIFGGGAAVGDFGGAALQWAAHGGQLSLSNAGDVITLADAEGAQVLAVSWGDCAGATCASDHIDGGLGIGESVTRSPELTGAWTAHTEAGEGRWSPGTRADGGGF